MSKNRLKIQLQSITSVLSGSVPGCSVIFQKNGIIRIRSLARRSGSSTSNVNRKD